MVAAQVVLAGGAWAASQANALASEPAPVQVRIDGSVVWALPSVLWPSPEPTAQRQACYRFGMPAQLPLRRWLEEEGVPVCRTTWEKNGIRYTQSVLITGPEATEGSLLGQAPQSVLLVRLAGENTASQYTEASATFAAEVEGRALHLELRDGVVYAAGPTGPLLVAVVDVAGEGIAEAAGPRLRFRGNMPPGTSGAMTIKIPAGKLEGEAAISRLRDLEFDDELRCVKRFWRARQEAGSAPLLPVVFAEGEKAR